jgi:hypothetical protein
MIPSSSVRAPRDQKLVDRPLGFHRGLRHAAEDEERDPLHVYAA